MAKQSNTKFKYITSLEDSWNEVLKFSFEKRRALHVIVQSAAALSVGNSLASPLCRTAVRALTDYMFLADKDFSDLKAPVVKELDRKLGSILVIADGLIGKVISGDKMSEADKQAISTLSLFLTVVACAADAVSEEPDNRLNMMFSYSIPVGDELTFPYLDAFQKKLDDKISGLLDDIKDEDSQGQSVRMLRLRVTLEGVSGPTVWRLIDVPDSFSFDKLHRAIQCCMPWDDMHLYNFILNGSGKTTIFEVPDPEAIHTRQSDVVRKDSRRAHVSKYLVNPGDSIRYVYDFGDDWVHTVELECAVESRSAIPVCIDGRGACPPEDCGGISGYEHLKKVMRGPHNEEYRDAKAWLGLYSEEEFQPDLCNIEWFNEELDIEFGKD